MKNYRCVKDLTSIIKCDNDWTPVDVVRCEFDDILSFVHDAEGSSKYGITYTGVRSRGKPFLIDLEDWVEVGL